MTLPFRNVRDEVPLHDRDFVNIRTEVMRRVSRPQRASWGWAVAAVAMLVAVVVLWPRGAEQRQPAPLIRASRTFSPRGGEKAVQVTAVPVVKVVHRPHRKARPHPAVVALAKPSVIELHTSNPDVRIIWIAR